MRVDNSQRDREIKKQNNLTNFIIKRGRDEDGTSGKVGGNDGDVLRSFHNDPSRLVTRRERRKIEEKRQTDKKR